MSASEFAFLSLGLVLGLLTGAALVEILRSRPIAQHEVRVTVAPDSLARRRATTLSEDAFSGPLTGVAAGGPADHGEATAAWPGTRSDPNDRSPLPPVGAGDPGSSGPRTETARHQHDSSAPRRRVGAGTAATTLASRARSVDSTGRPVMAVDVPAGMDEMLASLRRASVRAAASGEAAPGGRRRRSPAATEPGTASAPRRRVSAGTARAAEGQA